ncbi:MAG: hypothetical protein ACLFTV_13700 [Desulfococcaceae bacterium]
MNQSIDDHLSENPQRNAPNVLPSDFRQIGSAIGVLFQEQHYFVDGLGQGFVDLDMVEDVQFFGAEKPAALNPCIGEMHRPFLAEEKHRAFGWNESALVRDEEFQGNQFLLIQYAGISK